MAKVEIELNKQGVHGVLTSPEVAGVVGAIADQAAQRARSTAPVVSGDYRAGISSHVTNAAALGIHFRTGGDDRAVGVVVAANEKSAKVEARTGNLKRALRG